MSPEVEEGIHPSSLNEANITLMANQKRLVKFSKQIKNGTHA